MRCEFMPKRKCSNVDPTFGKNITEYRKHCELTQKQIADMLNLNCTTYTKYETGVSEPSIEIMKKIAAIFGVDINALCDVQPFEMTFADSDMPLYSLSREEQELVGIYRMFSNEEKEKVVEFITKMKDDKNNPFT